MREGKSIQELANNYIEDKSDYNFKTLYNRLKPGLVLHVYNIIKNAEASEDVVADTFTKIWQKIHQYDPYWNFSTWAYKIAENEARQWLRKSSKTYSVEAMGGQEALEALLLTDFGMDNNGMVEPNWYFDETVEPRMVLYEKVIVVIRELPTLYREIMEDREINKMKYEDISQKYNLELNTVKTRIKRAREKIKNVIDIKTA